MYMNNLKRFKIWVCLKLYGFYYLKLVGKYFIIIIERKYFIIFFLVLIFKFFWFWDGRLGGGFRIVLFILFKGFFE